MNFSEKIWLDEKLAARINGYLKAETPESYQGEDNTISLTAKFPDGCQMDVKCCGSQDAGSWTEAVLFDATGHELCCSEVEDEFLGEWSLEYAGNIYTSCVALAPKK